MMNLSLLRVSALFVILSLWSCVTQAAEFRTGEEVIVGEDEVIADDLYAFGAKVIIRGIIKGDLVTSCREVEIHGIVEGTVLAAGDKVTISGTVNRTARIAGNQLILSEGCRIDEDLVAAGNTLEMKPGATVGRDLLFAGHEAKLEGNIDRNVWSACGSCYLSGTVGNEFSVTTSITDESHRNDLPGELKEEFNKLYKMAPGLNGAIPGAYISPLELPPGLTLSEDAIIKGKFTYKSAEEATIEDGATIEGETEWLKPEVKVKAKEEPPTVQEQLISQGKLWGTFFLMGLLMVCFCPQSTGGIVNAIFDRPIASFFLGIVGIVLSVVGLSLISACIFGLPVLFDLVLLPDMMAPSAGVSILGTVLYLGSLIFFSWYGAPACVSMAFGKLIFREAGPGSRVPLLFAMIFGLIFYVAALNVPYLDIATGVIVTLLAFGGFTIWFMRCIYFGHPDDHFDMRTKSNLNPKIKSKYDN